MRFTAAPVFVALCTVVLAAPAPNARGALDAIGANDNRSPAGSLRDGVLTFDLEARLGAWRPDGEGAPSATIPAFSVAGAAPTVPGPLVRVPAGTVVEASLHNALADTLRVHGLLDRTGRATSDDSIVVAPGSTQRVRFRLDAPGTYYYWGTTTGRPFDYRLHEDAQLSGAIVVDPKGPPLRDRILLIGAWSDTNGRAHVRHERFLGVINGRPWPETERLTYRVGDTVRFRVINTTTDLHPMHLHGFYFRVNARGNGLVDTLYRSGTEDMVVTEAMSPGYTAEITWVPERAGNWLFHCHLPEHFAPRAPLGMRPTSTGAMHDASNHALGGMGGLVMGITVTPRAVAATTRASATRADDRPRFRTRLLIRPNVGSTDTLPYYAFAEQRGATTPKADSGLHVGRPLVLTRGEPAAITVVNTLKEATAVHWHGIELESYYDGVAGFSGSGARVSPLIAPRDSFEARMTPPRAGTFIYHTHVDEERQQLAGLAGPIIVLEPGQRFDPTTDHPIMLTSPSQFEAQRRAVLIDGTTMPDMLVLRAGVAHRLRFVNMTLNRPTLLVELVHDTTHATWRPLAKDGADFPAERRVPRPAIYARGVSVGETYDVEFTPETPGDLRLVVRIGGRIPSPIPFVTMPVRVVR